VSVVIERSGAAAARLAVVGAVGLSLGFLTAFGQAWLPEELGSLANSSGSWSLVAFALAWTATSTRVAAAFGSVSLLALLAGYVLGAGARGFAPGTALLLFWGLAAVLVGPLLGAGAHWVKTERGLAAAAGIGAMSGVLVGEGVYGLTVIADTTYPPYWWGQAILGVVLLAVTALWRLRGPRIVAAAVAAGAITAIAFVVVYSQNLISVLP
jgi:hypothetical protein